MGGTTKSGEGGAWWAQFRPSPAAPVSESMRASRRCISDPEDGSKEQERSSSRVGMAFSCEGSGVGSGAELDRRTGASAASSCGAARGEISARRRRPVSVAAGDGFAGDRRQDTRPNRGRWRSRCGSVVELGVVCLLLAVVGYGDAAPSLLPSWAGGSMRELLQSASTVAAADYTWQVGGGLFAHPSQLSVTMLSV